MRAFIGLIFLCLITPAFGQTPAPPIKERVFRFTHSDTVQQINELATLIRHIAEIQDVSVNDAARTVTYRGTATQMGMAEWLFDEIGKPANRLPAAQRPRDMTKHEYRVEGADDVLRVFYLTQIEAVSDFQEVATMIRSLTEIRRIFTFNQPRALAMRGTADQMAAAEWLINEVNQPAGGQRASREFPFARNADDIVSLLYLPDTATATATVADFQEVVVTLRSIGEIRRAFTYNKSRIVAIRATPAQIALARWLADQLTSAADRNEPSDSYKLNGDLDAVKVFYLPKTLSVAEFQGVAQKVRKATQIRSTFTYNAARALTVRGSLNQLATAQQIVTFNIK